MDYLKAQGIEGEYLETLRRQAAYDAKAEWGRRNTERKLLEESFRRGPEAYAETVKYLAARRRDEAHKTNRKGYRPTPLDAPA